MKVLLNHKCTIDPQDHEGITPLYLATYYGNYEIMKMLIAAFADVNAVTKVIFIFIFTVPLLCKAGLSSYCKPGTNSHPTPYQEHIFNSVPNLIAICLSCKLLQKMGGSALHN